MTSLNPNNLQNINDLSDYILDCIKLEGERLWPEIAARIVTGIACSPFIDNHKNNSGFPEIAAIFDLAADMEVPEVYGEYKVNQLAIKHLASRLFKRLRKLAASTEDKTELDEILKEYIRLTNKDAKTHWQSTANWALQIVSLLGTPACIKWYGDEDYGRLLKITALSSQLASSDEPDLKALSNLALLITQ